MNNCPDRWVVVTIESKEYGRYDKLFFGNYGGYAGSDTWKLNSGIVKVESIPDGYRFHGISGSVYDCHKNSYGMSSYMASVYNDFCDKVKAMNATIEVNKKYESN